MRNEIIIKNTIIISIGLFLFFIISLFVTSTVSRNSIEAQLVNVSKIINTQISDTVSEEELNAVVDSFTQNQNWLGITIANSDGVIVRDSNNDAVGGGYFPHLEPDEVKKANLEKDQDRVYLEGSIIYFVTKINQDIIVRTSVEFKADVQLMVINLFYLLILLMMVIILSIIQTRKISQNIIDTFKSICNHLKTINEGVYKEIDDNHKYPEVSEVLEEINAIIHNTALSVLKIKNEHDKTNFVINNMQQGIIIINSIGEVLLINDYAKRAFKFNLELQDIKYDQIIHNELILEKIKKSINNKSNYYFDVKDEEADKIYATTVAYLKKRWTDVKHKEELIVVSLIDVTEDRQNDMIKAEFISNASHELKTPITSIRGFSELLMASHDEYDEKTNKYVNIIYKEAVKMKETIDDLLYLSHLQNGREDPDAIEEIDFSELVDEVLLDYENLALEHHVEMLTDLDNVMINEQPKLIKHLISNLVENGIRYNKPGGYVKISVKDSKNNIILTVSDNGIGIDRKNLDKIFNRFYRAEESHNKNNGGTGLGLNIVKQICAIVNAKINVESEINKGTSFIVTFNKNE